MRITIDIPEELINDSLEISGSLDKNQLVCMALENLILKYRERD